MPRTRHLWLVMALDGRALEERPGSPAAFFTRRGAEAWAYNNCSFRPRVVKLIVPQEVRDA